MGKIFNTVIDNISTLAGKLGIFLSVRWETIYFLPKCTENALVFYEEPSDGSIYWGIIKETHTASDGKEHINFYEKREQLNPNTYQGVLLYWLDNFWDKNEDS